MKTRMRWIVPFLSLIAVTVASAAPLNRTQMQAMKKIYALQDKALLTKNVEALMAQTDVKFQRKLASGALTSRAQERRYIQSGFQHIKSFDSVRTTIKSSNFVSQKIVVVAQTRFSGLVRNASQDKPQDKWQYRAFTTTSRDTWVPASKGWKLRLTEEMP